MIDEKTLDCAICPERERSPFCGKLNEEGLAALSEKKKNLFFDKRQAIFYKGNPNHGVYILCSGSVRLLEDSPEMKMKTAGVVFAGDAIDKTTFFYSSNHLYTAETLEPCQVTFFEKEDFASFLKKNGEFSIQMMEMLSKEIENLHERNRWLLYKNGQQRLAGILLYLSGESGQKTDQGVLIPAEFKREELAELTGMTLESLVRWLSYFKKEKWIQLSGKKIIILDEEKLKKLTE